MGRKRAVFDRQRARELHDLGWGMRDIAAELGVGTMTVQRELLHYSPQLPLLRGVDAIESAGSTQQPSDAGSAQSSEPEREP